VLGVAAWLHPQPLRAEWPTSWPFVQSDEGWFFYRDPQPPVRSNTPDIEPLLPSVRNEMGVPPEENQRQPEGEEEEEEEAKAVPAQPRAQDNGTLHGAPTSGPALELWLSSVSDAQMEQLVRQTPAPSLRAWIPILLDHALTTLDRPSVRKYLLAQQETMRRSDRFSKLWQEVIWTDSTFDRPGAMPLGSMAQTLYEEDRQKTEQGLLKAMATDISLLLVVAPGCRPCEAQWQALSFLMDDYGFTAKPIASELVTLSDSSMALPYPGVIKSLAPPQLPSLYAVSVQTGAMRRLGSGLLSKDEIMTRLLRLFTQPDLKGVQQYAASSSFPADQQDTPEPSDTRP